MLKSYNFWIRLVAVVVLLLRIIGAEFGFSVDSTLIIDIATAIASVLVVLGVIQVPVKKIETDTTNNISNENNGGSFVKTFEQIKEDLTLVKSKIASSLFGEEGVKCEISAIIDGIILSDSEQKKETESLAGEVERVVIPETTKDIGCDENASEGCETEEEKIVDGEECCGQEVVEEGGSEVEAQSEEIIDAEALVLAERIVEDALVAIDSVITEDEKAQVDKERLNTIIRERIANFLATEIDNILQDASV